ncbi:hypothetical protein MTO96_029533 [Rhipicephalus appendiculatus]
MARRAASLSLLPSAVFERRNVFSTLSAGSAFELLSSFDWRLRERERCFRSSPGGNELAGEGAPALLLFANATWLASGPIAGRTCA